MPTDSPLVSLREARDRTIAILSDLFAKDDLELEEFERRVSLVHRAATVADVEKVTEDLAKPGAMVKAAPQPRTAVVAAAEVRDTQTIAAVFGGANRQGGWTAARQVRVVAIMGGVVLDFREARIAPGITDVSVFAMMGGVHVLVPPDLAVELEGTAIMGGFDHMDRRPPEADPDRPVLRVRGVAIMGGVAIETRLVGESQHEAQRRRKKERKALKRSRSA
jgi:Cell wall-active antibiotics response 4TMS YvqF/Domain of unknown function (DUF1707)